MEEQHRTILGIVTYVLLTFALSTVSYHAIIKSGSMGVGHGLFVLGLMWCPGVAGLITRAIFQKTLRGVGWRLGKSKYVWASYWIPIAYWSAVYLPFWALGYGNFHSSVLDRVVVTLHFLGLKPYSQAELVVLYILVTATFVMIPSCLWTLGEELGWRGFLVPEMAKVTSFTNVALISGVIWAAWHMPVIIGATYHGAGPRWYSVLCFTLGIINGSFVLAWLRLKSGSVWTAVLLHASNNLSIEGVFTPMTQHARVPDYIVGEFGIGVVITSGVFAYVLWKRRAELAV
jgi:uncharacterized protein